MPDAPTEESGFLFCFVGFPIEKRLLTSIFHDFYREEKGSYKKMYSDMRTFTCKLGEILIGSSL